MQGFKMMVYPDPRWECAPAATPQIGLYDDIGYRGIFLCILCCCGGFFERVGMVGGCGELELVERS